VNQISSIEEQELEQIKEYISKEVSDGFSYKDIRNTLLAAGHPPQYIDKVIQELKRQTINSKPQSDSKPSGGTKSSASKLPQKKRIFIIATCLIIITIVSILVYTKLNTNNPTESKELDIRLLVKAAESNDTKYCAQITDHNTYYDCQNRIWLAKSDCQFQELTGLGRDGCYFSQAQKSVDFMVCMKINDNVTRDSCLNKLYEVADIRKCADFALCRENWFFQNKNSAVCQFAAEVDSCYDTAAINLQDYTQCLNIKDPERKNLCVFNRAPKNVSGAIIPPEKLLELAINSAESDILIETNYCSLLYFKMNETQSSTHLVDMCYLANSLKSGDFTLCNEIRLDSLRKICLSYFIQNCSLFNEKSEEYVACQVFLSGCTSYDRSNKQVAEGCQYIKKIPQNRLIFITPGFKKEFGQFLRGQNLSD
jgi:hypothetical protein